jgi:endonuclease YncB( thermonuclease family)
MLAIPTLRLKRFLIASLVTLISSPALADTITGQASVIDGDTIEIHGKRIRLSGIDAPEVFPTLSRRR